MRDLVLCFNFPSPNENEELSLKRFVSFADEVYNRVVSHSSSGWKTTVMKPCIAAYSVGMLAVGDAFRGDFIFSQVEVQKVHKAFQEPSFHRVSVSTCKFLPCPRGILRTTTFPYFSLSRWWFCSSPSNAGILGTAFSFIGTTTPSFTIWRIIRGEHMKKAMVPANHGEEIT